MLDTIRYIYFFNILCDSYLGIPPSPLPHWRILVWQWEDSTVARVEKKKKAQHCFAAWPLPSWYLETWMYWNLPWMQWNTLLCVFFVFFWDVQFKKIGRIQESIETFFSSMSAGAQALYEDRTKTATLIGGLTLLAGGGSLVGGVVTSRLGRSGRGFLRNKHPRM